MFESEDSYLTGNFGPKNHIVNIASVRYDNNHYQAVTIKIREVEGYLKRFWCLKTIEYANPRHELTFMEPNIPLIIRQLYGVMVGRGATSTQRKRECSLVPNVFYLTGPHLAKNNHKVYDCDKNSETFFDQREKLCVTDLTDLANWMHFEPIFNMLSLPQNRPLALAVAYAARWRRWVANGSKRRALERTRMIKQEIVAAAWHPRRMVNWCLDTDEQEELRALWGAQ